jgi:four helix bundle protein
MDKYVHLAYKTSKNFPKVEVYGVTSQLRRAALSVILNYIEGYARGRQKVLLHFLWISYASLEESKYLLHFSLVEKYISEEEYKHLSSLADEIGAMLWKTIKGVEEGG